VCCHAADIVAETNRGADVRRRRGVDGRSIRSAWNGVYVLAALITLAVVLGGPVMTFYGVKGIVTNQQFLSSAVSTTGTVVDRVKHVEALESGTADHWYPVLRFTARTGQAVQFTPARGSDPPQLSVGRTVGVLYDPAHPHEARIDTWLSRWGYPTVISAFLLLGGLAVCGIAFFVLRFWLRAPLRRP
jgi:Protein of unknown function (DUF3592)